MTKEVSGSTGTASGDMSTLFTVPQNSHSQLCETNEITENDITLCMHFCEDIGTPQISNYMHIQYVYSTLPADLHPCSLLISET